jgi:hypothetical protein
MCIGGAYMDYKMNPNAVNQIPKGMTIFMEGEPILYIAMIIKGRVLIHNQGTKIIMGPGSFLGINDLYIGRYQSIYEAHDDIALYIYPVSKVEDLELILTANNEYHGYIVASHNKLIYELNNLCNNLIKQGAALHQFLMSSYQQCVELTRQKKEFSKSFKRIMSLAVTDSNLDFLNDRINYYSECNNLPISVVKQFFSYGNTITLFEVEEQVNIINQQLEALKNLADSYVFMSECIMDDTDSCLFHVLHSLAEDDELISDKSNYMIDIMDDIINEINKAASFIRQNLNRESEIDRMKIEELYDRLLTGNKKVIEKHTASNEYSEEDIKQALEVLKDSFSKILNYAGITGEKADAMQETMQEYIMLKDKYSNDERAREIRRQLTDNHYNLYKETFIKAYKDVKVPKLIELFLKYGYADERLLSEEQILSLYFMPDDDQDTGLCKVYDIRTWLTLIYEEKKEPSKNEFDLDYTEMLSEMKKQGKLTEKECISWLSDSEKKLDYEIKNMFRYNNRTTNGQISTFVPVLHKDQAINDIKRIRTTCAKIKASVDKFMQIDYSVFDREILYTNQEKNIKREYIIRKVYPDIILMPNVGVNGVMWQEITGKRRDTPGRFLLPAFTEIDMDAMLVRLLGKFRWEMCRTIEGALWNNITKKSLTSEYTYYLQFYRKNKDLSEEKKEKIKNQIQRGRNSREVFVVDYENWILYEAAGAIKLNKPVREILATYCPLSKEIREQLKHQPLFDEAMTRYYHEKQKKIREIVGRYRLLEKENIEVTQELLDTLSYYKEA